MAVPFTDLGRVADNLLEREFTHDISVRMATTSTDGSNFETSLTSEHGATPGAVRQITGTLVGKWKSAPWNMDVQGRVDTANRLSGFVSSSDKLIRGLVLAGEAVRDVKNGNSARVGAVFRHPVVHTKLDMELSKNNTLLTGSTVLCPLSNIHVGASAAYRRDSASKEGMLTDLDGKAVYESPSGEYAVTGAVLAKADKVSVSYVHHVDKRLTVAGQFERTRKEGFSIFSAGAKYQVDAYTHLMGKVSSTGIVDMLVSHKLGGYADLQLSAQLDAMNLEGADSHRFGIAVALHGMDI